jgi:hypothetical protein
MSKKFKLIPALLRKIIAEEKQKLTNLGMLKESKGEKNIKNVYKKLQLKENKLKTQLRKVQVLKEKIRKQVKKTRR